MIRCILSLGFILALAGCGQEQSPTQDSRSANEPPADAALDEPRTAPDEPRTAADEPRTTADEAQTALDEPRTAPAGQPPAVAETCNACHGMTAPSPHDDIPTIHGLPSVVIENALYDFRAETRPCRQSTCSARDTCPDTNMCQVTADLSDTEIGLLAGWYSAQTFAPVDEPHDPELAAQGREIHDNNCETCHADGATRSEEQASLLRGQPKAYLNNALQDYRLADRQAVIQMDTGLESLNDDDIAALVEFYSSPVNPDD